MRRLAPFGPCGLLVLAGMALQAAWAQSQPAVPLSDQVEQRLQQMRKDQKLHNAPGPNGLTMNELDRFRARLAGCWDPPEALKNQSKVVVTVQVKFAKDGSLSEPPKVLNPRPDPLFAMAAKIATAALTKCAPFNFMPVAKYEGWKEVTIDFDTRAMFGDQPR